MHRKIFDYKDMLRRLITAAEGEDNMKNMTVDEFNEKNEIENFIFNPENILNCTECPYNEHFDDFQGRYPCGQWNCWIELNTRCQDD